ncbi:DUF6879 family protein [Streptomyces sp. CA-111067]|uniref:DUF6879 family protein n=1 Tax=Streptomyces sp. CA-111067 TaxID=3240046 RepID=UPI003D967552
MPQIDFKTLMDSARASAVHLEMRDVYGVEDEADDFADWRKSGRRDADPASDYWAPWMDLISRARSRGVAVRRARIVSEPVTEYIRYEHAGTAVNILAGEEVRWLPRRRAATLLVPGSDLWVFDGATVLFNHFTGDGNWSATDMELTTDPAVARQCSEAFETIWERAVPHDQYEIR